MPDKWPSPARDEVTRLVRQKIADGTLKPGAAAPSGTALAGETGFYKKTCRAALRALEAEGVLVRPSPRSWLYVAAPPEAVSAQPEAVSAQLAGEKLSASLKDRRQQQGLTQKQLAEQLGVPVTTVAHAETGRLWQVRPFWERAAGLLGNGVLDAYDTYKAEQAARPDVLTVTVPAGVTAVFIRWHDGTEACVQPPDLPGL